ncbi:MAG: PAN/Apple domain-containing protein, partial [Cypionkella sp.]
MRAGFGRLILGVVFSLSLLAPNLVAAEELVPEKRFVISENTDLPGGDIASIFDTTLEACQRACTTNKACKAFTFNQNKGVCF